MFESTSSLDAESCLTAVETNERAGVEQSCGRLILAAQWADLHPGEACDPHGLPGCETPSQPGGDGTPTIGGFAPVDLGLAMGTTAWAAARLIGDALDLRHRLPRCWRRVLAAEVPGHHARRVAQVTRHLSREAAGRVDTEIAEKLSALSFGRLDTCLDAAVYRADPAAAEAEAELALRDRFVRLGRTTKHGMKLIIARATAGDAIYLDAMIARLADILRERGDLDPLDTRRSKAIGILGRPADALQLLYEHAHADGTGADADDEDSSVDADSADGADGADAASDPVDQPEPDAEPEQESGPEPEPDDDYNSVTIVPPPFDPSLARPTAKLYVHLSAEALAAGHGVARMEGLGPVLLRQLRSILGDHMTIRLQPVIDLNDQPAPVDSYEIPGRIREHVILRNPADRFPYAGGMARGPNRTCDLDHSNPYVEMDQGGPPGQTSADGLGPLVRFHHRVCTHGHCPVRQPEPGTYVWRTRYGRVFLVNNTGTHPLGHGPFAQAVWNLADPDRIAGFRRLRTGWFALAS